MSGPVPSNLRQFLGQLQELIQYVQTVEESRSGEALSRTRAEAEARAYRQRAEELARLLGVVEPRIPVLEEARRQALSQLQQAQQENVSLRARLSESEARTTAALLDQDALRAQLAELGGLKQMSEKQFTEAMASQSRQVQTAMARYTKDREDYLQKADQLRKSLQETSRELHEVRISRDRLLSEVQRESQAREQLQKQLEEFERKLHEAQAERSRATHLAKMSSAEAFEARDRADLLERRMRTLEGLVGESPTA